MSLLASQRQNGAFYPRYLPGIFEHTNRVNGFIEEDIPVLVGNEKLALSVIANGSDVPSIKIQHDSRLALDLFKGCAKVTSTTKTRRRKSTWG